VKLAARGSLKIQDAKKSPKIAIWSPRINNRKKLLSSNISFRCPHNKVNFGPLAVEIDPVVWGIPANFNRLHVLAALLHGTPVVGVSQTLLR